MTIPFSSEELLIMLNEDNLEPNTIAARRIWTDWNILENKKLLQEGGDILFDLLQNSTDEKSIWHFMLAIACLNYTQALPVIVSKLKESQSDNIRGFAAEALGKFDKVALDNDIHEILFDRSKHDPSIVVRVNSIRALGKIYEWTKCDDLALKFLKIVNVEENSMVRSVIIETIGKIGSLKPVPELIHIMITRRIELLKDSSARALDNIAKMHGLQDRKALMDQLKVDYTL